MKQTNRNSSPGSFTLWLKVVRAQSLFASFCPVMVGLMLARKDMGYVGVQGHATALLTLISAFSLQILSNLVNDIYDFKRGADKVGRAGFKRVLVEGWITESQMRHACYISLFIAILTGFVLCIVGGWIILIIGLTSILFAWLYTATDHSLSYLGIADIFVFLYYGVIAVCGTVWLQYRSVGLNISLSNFSAPISTSFYAGAVCGLISMCVLAINNIRDIDDDRQVGKRTIPVRFGRTIALVLFGIIVALMPVFAWLAFGISWAMIIVIPAIYLYYKVIKSTGADYNQCLIGAGLLNVCYMLLVWLSI